MKNYKFSLKLFMLAACFVAFMPACTDLEEEVFSEVTADNFFQTEEEFISAIRGQESVRFTDFATGLKYMEFTDAVHRSAETNLPVEL